MFHVAFHLPNRLKKKKLQNICQRSTRRFRLSRSSSTARPTLVQQSLADRIAEHIIEGTFLQERISERAQIVDMPVPPILVTLHLECTSERAQTVDGLVSHILEEPDALVHQFQEEAVGSADGPQPSPAEELGLQCRGLRGLGERPDAGDVESWMPTSGGATAVAQGAAGHGVTGALAWLTSRPARSEEPLVKFTSHGYRWRCAHGASSLR